MLRYRNHKLKLTRSDVKKMTGLHPQLQRLSIKNDFNLDFWDYASKKLEQLEHLELTYDSKQLRHHSASPIQFENVKTLQLNITSNNNDVMPAKVFAFKQLKECTLVGSLDGVWIDFVIACPTIQQLHFKMVHRYPLHFNQNEMRQIAAALPNLTRMRLDWCSCTVQGTSDFLNESVSIQQLEIDVFENEEENLGSNYSIIQGWWNVIKITKGLILFTRKKVSNK